MSIMENKVKISTQNLNLYYGENHALKNINLDLYENKITAFIGPSGCGKSTYLKTLNRMNDLVPNVKIEGTVLLDGEDIYDPPELHSCRNHNHCSVYNDFVDT